MTESASRRPQLHLPSIEQLRFHQVVSAPRNADEERLDARRPRLVAAIVNAHLAQSPVGVVWIRPHPAAPLAVLVGGAPVAHAPVEECRRPVPLLYPPGSVGLRLGDTEIASTLLHPFPVWTRCVGVFELGLQASAGDPSSLGMFEDYVAFLHDQPFAWVVVGQPLPSDELVTELRDVRLKIPYLRNKGEGAEDARVEAERLEARYRELVRARAAGLWNVHVLVGGPSEDAVRRLAGLLCAGADLARLPYRLVPHSTTGTFAEISESIVEGGTGDSPFRAPADLLAAIARPPDIELPGFRLTARPTFAVAADRPASLGGVQLGTILDENLAPAGLLEIPLSALNRHMFVCGATGSGKSQTVRALLEELARAAVPWLVIEPAKAEYGRMAGRLPEEGEVVVIRPGDPDLIPASLNPLEPEPRFPLQSHLDMVKALFLAAFQPQEPLPQVLSLALTRCYEELGWDLVLGEARVKGEGVCPKYPRLADLQRTAQEVVHSIGYGQEVTQNVQGFIDVRLGSLRLGAPGRFFEGGHAIDIGHMLRRNVVLEIENVTSDQDKAFLIGAVLIRLIEHLRIHDGKAGDAATLRHVTVIEEAHRLLRNMREDSPAAHAVGLFAGLLSESRAYGEGIVVVEQIPTKLLPDVIKNTAVKLMHRQPAQDDRQIVGATMNLTPQQSEYLVAVKPGRAAVFSGDIDRPLLVSIPLGEDRESAVGADLDPPLDPTRRRAAACASDCFIRGCTMREIREAETYAEDPTLVLWVELLVIAHINGDAPPEPHKLWLNQLRAVEKRHLQCALAHRLQSATGARYKYLTEWYQPEELENHVARYVLHVLYGEANPCAADEFVWQAGWRRWADVARALDAGETEASGDRSRPHPDTGKWRARGLTLESSTWDEQKAEVASRSRYKWHSALVRGDRSPPLFEWAAAQLSDATTPAKRMTEATRVFGFAYDWVGPHLYGDPEGQV